MAVALIVAAGSGERLGADRPKAFVLLAGRPMVMWSVDHIRAVPAVSDVVVALPTGHDAPPGTVGVRGAQTRSQSVRAALGAAPAGDPVLVHDAARPLVSPALVEALLEALETSAADAVVPAVRVPDTIKRAGVDGMVSETLDRGDLWSIQTPQVFRRAALEMALEAEPVTLAGATDDASLIEFCGGKVAILESGFGANFKITTPEDFHLASLLLWDRRC